MSTEKNIDKKAYGADYEIAAKKYGEENVIVFDVVKDNGETLENVVAVKPSYSTACKYLTFMDKSMEMASNAIINACLLTHKERIKGDTELSLAVSTEIAKEIKIAETKRKK